MGDFDTILSFADNDHRRISKEEIHRVTDSVIGIDRTEELFSAIQARRYLDGELLDAKDLITLLCNGIKDIKECLSFIDAFRHHTVRYKGMKGEQESFMSDWRKVTEKLLVDYLDDLQHFCSTNPSLINGTAYRALRDEMLKVPSTDIIHVDDSGLIADKDLDEIIKIVNGIANETDNLNDKINRRLDNVISGIINSLPNDFPHGRRESRAIYEAMSLCGLISSDLIGIHNNRKKNKKEYIGGDSDPKGDYIRQFFARKSTTV